MNRQWFDNTTHRGASHPFDSPLAGEQRSLPPLDAENFRVLGKFSPRFERWWQNGSGEHATRMQRRLHSHLDAETTRILLENLQRFHRINDDIESFDVDVITAPGGDTRATHAEVRGNSARVESIMGESSSARVGVVLHEAAHYLYAQTSTDHRSEIRGWFLDNPSAWSLAAYNLLNEAIASAFGNALAEKPLLSDERYQRLLDLPESLYADAYVDRAAKAVLPILESYLRDAKAIDRQFVDSYIEAVGQQMGGRMTELPFWLRQMVFAATATESLPLVQEVAANIRTGALLQEDLSAGCGERCLLGNFSELSGILLTSPIELDGLAGIIPSTAAIQIRRAALTAGLSVYGIKRSDRSLLYVITASNIADQRVGLRRLLEYGFIFTGELGSASAPNW